MFLKRFLRNGWFTLLWISRVGYAQVQCAEPFSFTPVSQLNSIEWAKFPEFTLPFTIIYAGPRFDTGAQPLKHGFSHLGRLKDGDPITPKQVAIEWSGVAYGLNQPWETLQSPWNNDLNAYHTKWDQWLRQLSGGQQNAQGKWVLPTDVLMLDIERFLDTDSRILALKTNDQTPAQYRQLADADFLTQYKKDMTALYAESIRYVRERADLSAVRLSTYSDTPIRNTYLNVVANSWQDWTTNPARVNYITKDPATNTVGGTFYQQLDFLGPSSYYYYDYPSALAGDYLAYLLFQIEANRAWSNKPVIPFVWMRYHDCCGSYPKFIQPFMAEATAIFPFFAGAKGLWLWEAPNFQTSDATFAPYEHFVHGLYRLSQFKDMFEGDYELVMDEPATEHMNNQTPIWRGVVKESQLLVAAHNPYASANQTTTLTVNYKSWQTQITLTGTEVYLCKFDLSVLGAPEPPVIADLTLSPNPARTSVAVSFTTAHNRAVDVQLMNALGQIIKTRRIQTSPDQTRLNLGVHGLPAGLYFVRVTDGQAETRKKLLIVN